MRIYRKHRELDTYIIPRNNANFVNEQRQHLTEITARPIRLVLRTSTSFANTTGQKVQTRICKYLETAQGAERTWRSSRHHLLFQILFLLFPRERFRKLYPWLDRKIDRGTCRRAGNWFSPALLGNKRRLLRKMCRESHENED